MGDLVALECGVFKGRIASMDGVVRNLESFASCRFRMSEWLGWGGSGWPLLSY